MPTAEADITTEHAARYLARLCGHLGKMGAAGHRLGRRRPSHAGGGMPPEVRRAECSQTEGTVSLNWGQWTMRARPGLLVIRAEAADEESLRRIQDLLTARLEKFGRREHLTVSWHRPAQPATDPEADARTPVRSEDLLYRTTGKLARPPAGRPKPGEMPLRPAWRR
jgi:hypothetical protein